MKKFIHSAAAFAVTAFLSSANAMSFGSIPNYEVSSETHAPVINLEKSIPIKKSPAKAPATTDEIELTFARQISSALTLNIPTGTNVYQAMVISSDICEKYAGKTITAFTLLTGIDNNHQNGVPEVTVFTANDFNQDFTYTQTAQLGSEAYAYNKIELDKPITIEKDKPFIIGYFFSTTSTSGYFVTFDKLPTNNTNGGYLGYTKDGAIAWDNISSIYGSLNIGVTVKGGEYDLNSLSVSDCELPEFVYPNEPFSLVMTVCNSGAGEIKSLEVEYQIGDAEKMTAATNFNEALRHNQIANVSLSELTCNNVSANVPFTIKITKVNGVENVATDNSFTADLVCFNREDGYKRNFLVEEGTGTWCVWCPAGIVMMEYLKKNFPDNVIRVALHASQSAYSKDPMAISSASTIINKYFSGFPEAMIDRTTNFAPTGEGILPALSQFFNAQKNEPTFGEIKNINVVCGDNNSVSISTDAVFALDIDNANNYRLAYYITEDGVGPYNQSNIYSGGKYGEMEGWENKTNPVSTYYDDVARYYLGGLQGLTNSLPQNIVKQQPCNYSFDYTIPTVSNQYFYVTAIILDPSGKVINARQIKASKTNAMDRNEIADNKVTVSAGRGFVTIDGKYTRATVYTISGQRVSETFGESTISLASGLYILNIDGESFKVVVK